MNDLRFAFRLLLKNPGFTAVAVLTLALGIGANTAMFSFLNAFLLRPLPFPDADHLVRVFRSTPQDASGNFSATDYLELQRDSTEFGQFAAYEYSNLAIDDDTHPTSWVRVTPGLFGVLGVGPELGRGFRHEEANPGHDRVALISHWLWRDRFGGTRDVIGQMLRAGGESYEVVGVMPPAATDHRLFNQVGVFIPLVIEKAFASAENTHQLNVLGRRDKAISAGRADAFLAALGSRRASELPEENADSTWRSEGLPESGMSPTGQAILWMLLGLSGFVLLIACSNLANFLLARTVERMRELAVRVALGASRSRLLRPLTIESLLLAILGGSGALLVSLWTTGWLHSIIWNNGGPTIDFSVDVRVLSFTLVVSVVTILFFGVSPALLTLRINANDALKSGARGGTPGRGHQMITRSLIAGQFALAMVLLAGAGFFVRGAINTFSQEYGWNSKDVIKCDLVLPVDSYPDNERISAFHRQLINRVGRLPGVRAASVSYGLPFLGLRGSTTFMTEGDESTRQQTPQVFLNDITSDYFAVTGTRLLGGRTFNLSDTASSPRVAIISETMARTFFPDQDPVGRRLAPAGSESPEWIEIVGVIADTRSIDLADKPVTYQLYRPMAQNPGRAFVLAVRTEGVPVQDITSAIREAVAGIDPSVVVEELMTADRMIAQMTSQLAMVRQLLGAFAALGLFLAVLGIYGMLARAVVQRTGEIGIRMALGAQIRDVVRLILGFGIRIAAIGSVLGILGAVGLSRLLGSVLPSMHMNTPWVIAGAALLLLALALAASWLPTRRASRIEPMTALRAE